ncbi:MAG: MutS2/Smr-associated SH3 domain-containing protein [Ferruginibacter sp.]
MKFFPGSTLKQLEFNKIKDLLVTYCKTDYARTRSEQLRIHTKKEFILKELGQTNEYKILQTSLQVLPNDFILNISKEIKLLSIPGATLTGDQFLLIKRLSENTANIFRWFDNERKTIYAGLATIIAATYYEPVIKKEINEVLDDIGHVKDSASAKLSGIRINLYRKRHELRRMFDRLVSKLNKLGYLADIEESFMNGRRVLAVMAEQKRMIKGVLHGESDSRRTSFIEPEETTDLNNAVYSLEYEETKEVNRILKKLTSLLSVYAPLLHTWHNISGELDFIHAKSKFAIEINGNMPVIKDKAIVNFIDAVHPLLLIYNKALGKPTVPVNLALNDENRILVISGPNAGGKTVTLKTVGLLQVMVQAGLLVPASPDSELGIFKQLMIHIGDTQSLEFELSTYSSQLRNMKHFLEAANGKTLFFIDELGSGSDPNLGGAFAEVIMEELAFKHSIGIVTTHYLNLKVMANKVKGIINGAMQFDEKNLLPLYKLQVGKPGSSYTFSIAARIGLDKKLIERARQLVEADHFRLDKLLNRTEQDLQKIDKQKSDLQLLVKENEHLKKEMEKVIEKETHQQEIERYKHQNKIAEDKLIYLKDMERKLKAMVVEWKRAEDKTKAVQMIQSLLFSQKDKLKSGKQQKKLNEKYEEVGGDIHIGDKVKMQHNRQVGVVRELRGKKAILQVGIMPMTVELKDLVVVREK